MALPKIGPEEAAQKWARRLSGATEDIRAGIARVTEAPGAKAAAKAAKWEQGVMGARDKWKRNVGRVSLEEWRQKATDVGVARVAQGAQANVDKYSRVAAELFPHISAGQQAVARMPDTTLEERIQRSIAMQRHMAGFRRGGSAAGGGV